MRDFAAENVPKPRALELESAWLEQNHLDLEIGAGQGLHAIRYARAHPGRFLFAVERTHGRFAKMSGRFETHDAPENLKIVHADAVGFVTHFLKNESLERVFLLYPNPYPKTKQANLRWHNRPFMRLLLARMRPGATLTLATNLDWYAEEAAKMLTGTWGLELLEKRALDPERDRPRTHFEKKYLARGENCLNLILRKANDGSSIEA